MRAGIVGAGIVGRLLAYELQNAGWHITLFDQGGDSNCSHAAAGLLTPITELEKNDSVIYDLGDEAIGQHWPQLLEEIGGDIYFKQTGTLAIAHPQDKNELLQLLQMIEKKLTKKIFYHRLDQREMMELEPQLTKFNEGYFFPHEGQIDSQTMLLRLENKLKNIIWYKDTLVERIEPNVITFQDRSLHFDMVFDCRGLGAVSRYHDLRGVRGELIWLHAPQVIINRPIRLMHPRYSIYIAPRPENVYLVGATEIESNDLSSISVRSLLELLTAVFSVHSGFSEARLLKTVTQCRPTLRNHLPKICYTDGLIAINGLYRHGFLIAPTLIADIMIWINKGMTSIRYPQLWEKCA